MPRRKVLLTENAKKQANRERVKRFRAKQIHLGKAFEFWSDIKSKLGSKSDADVAKILLESYTQIHGAALKTLTWMSHSTPQTHPELGISSLPEENGYHPDSEGCATDTSDKETSEGEKTEKFAPACKDNPADHHINTCNGDNDLILIKQEPFDEQEDNSANKHVADEESQLGTVIHLADPTAICWDEHRASLDGYYLVAPIYTEADMVFALSSNTALKTEAAHASQTDLTLYWCNFCSFKSENKQTVLQHAFEHMFCCKFCKFQSYTRAQVIRHCHEKHPEFKETAKNLNFCSYLTDISQLQRAEKRKGNAKKKPQSAKRSSVVPVSSASVLQAGVKRSEMKTPNTSSHSAIQTSLPGSSQTSTQSAVFLRPEFMMPPLFTYFVPGQQSIFAAPGGNLCLFPTGGPMTRLTQAASAMQGHMARATNVAGQHGTSAASGGNTFLPSNQDISKLDTVDNARIET